MSTTRSRSRGQGRSTSSDVMLSARSSGSAFEACAGAALRCPFRRSFTSGKSLPQLWRRFQKTHPGVNGLEPADDLSLKLNR
jgi:hypothetical protein